MKEDSVLLANTQGQPLKEHLLAVAKRTVENLASFGLEEGIFNTLKKASYLSGLFHDIGKIDPHFQGFIKNKLNKNNSKKESTDSEELRNPEEKQWHGVFHQEISWAYLTKYISVLKEIDGPDNKGLI